MQSIYLQHYDAAIKQISTGLRHMQVIAGIECAYSFTQALPMALYSDVHYLNMLHHLNMWMWHMFPAGIYIGDR
jgi:hypothetical protein